MSKAGVGHQGGTAEYGSLHFTLDQVHLAGLSICLSVCLSVPVSLHLSVRPLTKS